MLLKAVLQRILSLYQVSLSPALGSRCRFYPSCSHYAQEVLEKYSIASAVSKISSRLLRCQPWNAGGIDLP